MATSWAQYIFTISLALVITFNRVNCLWLKNSSSMSTAILKYLQMVDFSFFLKI